MDDVDLRVCQLLMLNSRTTQRELADKLGITVASVHRRVEALIENKIIRGFSACISRGYVKALPVQIEGISECRSISKAVDELRRLGTVQSVLVAAANLTTATMIVKDVSELGPTVEKIRNTLMIPRPNVTISMRIYAGNEPVGKEYTGRSELTRLDYLILNAIHHDARKPVVDIAEEVGLTPKTVRLHLEQMEADGAVEYGLRWDPSQSTGSCFILRVDLKPGVDRMTILRWLNERFGAKILLSFIHSNQPDLVCGYCWTPTAAKHQEMVDMIAGDERVAKASSGIIHQEWGFETWLDRLLKQKAQSLGPRN